MISSREQVLSQLNKWRSEACMIAFSFEGVEPSDSAFLWGFVVDIAGDSIVIASARD